MTQVTHSKSKKNIKADKLISIAIMSSFAVLSIQYFILYYFNLIENVYGSAIQLLSKGIVGFFFLIAFSIVLKRNCFFLINVYVISISVFLLNYLIFPQNTELLNSVVFPFFFTCLPCFVYSYSVKNIKVFMDVMVKVSIIVFAVGTLIGVLVVCNRMYIGTYSMSLSYYMLLPTLVSLNDFFQKKSFKLVLVAVISILIILALGARGPLLCIGVYFILYLIKNSKITYNYIMLYMVLFSLLILTLFFLDDILNIIYYLLSSIGIHSRTLRLLLGDYLHLSGRDKLYSEILFQIKENPLLGIGLAGDRLFIGTYSHNIFLEIVSGFGILLGIPIIIIIGLIILRSLFLKDKNAMNFMLIWFSLGFVPLLVSGSYLIDFKFWIFSGFAIRGIKYNRF